MIVLSDFGFTFARSRSGRGGGRATLFEPSGVLVALVLGRFFRFAKLLIPTLYSAWRHSREVVKKISLF